MKIYYDIRELHKKSFFDSIASTIRQGKIIETNFIPPLSYRKFFKVRKLPLKNLWRIKK